MLIEVLYHAISLDIGFFMSLVMLNLFWVFALLAAYKMLTNKRIFPGFFVFVGVFYALQDVIKAADLHFFPLASPLQFFALFVLPFAVITENTRLAHYRLLIIT